MEASLKSLPSSTLLVVGMCAALALSGCALISDASSDVKVTDVSTGNSANEPPLSTADIQFMYGKYLPNGDLQLVIGTAGSCDVDPDADTGFLGGGVALAPTRYLDPDSTPLGSAAIYVCTAHPDGYYLPHAGGICATHFPVTDPPLITLTVPASCIDHQTPTCLDAFAYTNYAQFPSHPGGRDAVTHTDHAPDGPDGSPGSALICPPPPGT